jgi:hypothetical protein
MTDIYDLTEQLENGPFLSSSGYPISTGSSATQTPFYVDSNGDLNFGYGIQVYDGADNTINTAALIAMAASSGGNMSAPDLDLVSEWLNGDITLSQLNSSITSQDWRPTAEATMEDYYDTVATDVANTIGTASYDSFNDSVQEALDLMWYNSGNGFLGSTHSNIRADLASQNYAATAYELAFGTANTGSPTYTAYEDRSLIGAAFMLGLDPSIDGYNTINGLSATSDANNATLVNFAENVAEYAPSSYFSTTPVKGFLKYFDPYLIPLGYYLTQPIDIGVSEALTAANIVTNNSITLVDGAELARLNDAYLGIYSGSTFYAGGLAYVPTAADTSVSAATSTSPDTLSSIASSGENYIYDSNVDSSGSDAAYAIGSYPTNYGTIGTGSLSIVINSGIVAASFESGWWADIYDGVDSDSNAVINIDITNGSGTVIGTLSIEKDGSGQYYTSKPPSGDGSPTTTHLSGGPTIVTSGGSGSGTGSGDSNDGGPTIWSMGGQGYYIDPTTGAMWPISGPFPDGGPTSNGPDTGPVAGQFSASQNTDPIVLDLSGDNAGVQLTPLAGSSAYFDLYNTGFAVNTGWVGPTTGILVNTTDPTNITDLFGSSSTSGFAALKALDVYDTGTLNSSDPGWSGLYVWVDANGNGTVDSGEVKSLSSLGITSISLNTSPEDETVNGNYIGDVATFSYSGGTGQVAEAFFNNTSLDSTFSGSYTLNPEALLLPDLRGYGTMPDLYVAESLDPTLLSDVAGLAGDSHIYVSPAANDNEASCASAFAKATADKSELLAA